MDIKAHFHKVYSRISNLIKKGYVTLPNNDLGDYSVAQTSYYGKVTDVQTIYPYGLSANAPVNTLMLLFNNMGQEENISAIPYGTKERFSGLKAGEVAIGSPLTGSYVKFTNAGDVQILSKNNIDLIAVNASYNYNGNVVITASEIKINDCLTISSEVKFEHNQVGGGSALIGTNSPATVLTAPYTWIKVMAADDTVCYIPAWK